MKPNVCTCKACKKQRKKGFILGSVRRSFWHPIYGFMDRVSVDAYIPFRRNKPKKRKTWNE